MHHINHMRTSDEPILVDKIQSIAVFVWRSSIEGNGATTDDIDFFRSNPLHLQRKKSLRSNTFALRTNGKNENQYVRTEKFAGQFFFGTCEFHQMAGMDLCGSTGIIESLDTNFVL